MTRSRCESISQSDFGWAMSMDDVSATDGQRNERQQIRGDREASDY